MIPCRLDLHAQHLSLAGLRFGPTQGRPIVLVHGFLDQCLSWAQAASRLAARLQRPVLAFDQRGHGRSDHIPPGGAYHVWDHVADLDAVVAQEVERNGQPIDLVGHSMGGTVCALLAATHPATLRRLALLEGLGPTDYVEQAVARARDFLWTRHTPRRHPLFGSIDEAASRMRAVDPSLSNELALRLAERATRPAHAGDPDVRDTDRGSGVTWRWDVRHRARHPYPFSADLHRRFLRAIEAPTLVLTAEHGMRPPDHGDRIHALRDSTVELVRDAGHMLHRDRPAEVASHLAAFFGE